jgi:hypothetical protein
MGHQIASPKLGKIDFSIGISAMISAALFSSLFETENACLYSKVKTRRI